jgi:glycosyltransferase involved in cell wall biosynthesis
LCRGLKALIEDQALRMALGEAARREVAARYTWKRHTRKIVEKLHRRAVDQKWLPHATANHLEVCQEPG